MSVKNDVLSRVLEEVKASKGSDSVTTSHQSYVSGVFEDEAQGNIVETSDVLARVLEEVKASKGSDSVTTSHTSYVSGVFE